VTVHREAGTAPSRWAKLTAEKQDQAIVEQVATRVKAILTRDEEIIYIAVQAKPILNICPDCVVLTNNRLILYHAKLLGRVDFEDYLWLNLADARLEENIIGSTLSFTLAGGRTISMDYLPKDQARRLYQFAQENEQAVFEVRRQRRMEEDRARAGGVNIQNNIVPSGQAAPPSPTGDPMAALRKLKDMLDAGLISAEDFESKKREVLSRL